MPVIPDGPLHPEDAVAGVIVGLALGALFGRQVGSGPILVAGAMLTLAVRQPSLVPEGIVDRPAPLAAAIGAAAIACLWVGLMRIGSSAAAHTTVAAAVAGCAGVWATAPDTEPALIGGAVLAGAWPLLGRATGPLAPSVMLVPAVAALIGTVGRPDRLSIALGAATLGVVTVRAAAVLAALLRDRRQRAGTPTTVAPGATSDVTTAPAPTTAP